MSGAPREPETALRDAVASADGARVRQAVSAWAEHLRTARGEDDARPFAEACAPLASHGNPKVRQSVADAADVVPEDVFDEWLARFTADEDSYVRAAIARAAKRRATRRKARARQGEHDKAVADLLAEMEAKHGKPARRLAERAVRRGTSSFVRKLHHEAAKIVTPLEFSLNRLRSEVVRPDLDRPVLVRNVGLAWERLQHLWAVIDRARDATATVTPRFEDEALLPLVQEARAQLVDRLGPRASRLAFVANVDPAMRLDADRSALLQALQNFLQNAVEAYPDDAPRIEVSVAARPLRADSQVEVTVVDRGVGMSEDERDHLFVPFGSRKPGGTGVGLVIARAMIEEVHGGSLTLDSARGRGTTVTLVLPARQTGLPARPGRSRS
jgi:two-component system cell cycle sensor histidine kinase PleC